MIIAVSKTQLPNSATPIQYIQEPEFSVNRTAIHIPLIAPANGAAAPNKIARRFGRTHTSYIVVAPYCPSRRWVDEAPQSR